MADTATEIVKSKTDGQRVATVQPDTRGAEERVVMDLLNRSDLPVERIDGFLARLDLIRERNEAAQYNDSMRQVKATLPVVGRTTDNSHTRKKYADLADIASACDTIIADHGFSTEFWPFNSEKPGHLGIGCTVSHSSGHQRTYKADVPLDGEGAKGNSNKPAIHAWKSTMTYGRRTLKEAIFDIATSDDDGNIAARVVEADPQYITMPQVVELRTMLLNAGADEADFLKAVKLTSLELLAAENFDAAVKRIKLRADNAKKKEAAQ